MKFDEPILDFTPAELREARQALTLFKRKYARQEPPRAHVEKMPLKPTEMKAGNSNFNRKYDIEEAVPDRGRQTKPPYEEDR
jgi:hypothetical protein